MGETDDIKIEPDGTSKEPRESHYSSFAAVRELRKEYGNHIATLDEVQARVEALEGAYYWQMRTTGIVLVSLMFLLIATKQLGKQLELTTGAVRAMKLSADSSV